MIRSLVTTLLMMGISSPVFAQVPVMLDISAAQRAALGIEVRAIEARELVPRPLLPGRVALPNNRIRLVTAMTSGVLIEPRAAVGDAIRVDQELARVASPDFIALQREYLDALSQHDLTRSTAEREQQLAEEGIIPGRRADQSTAELRDARARLAELRQALRLTGASEAELAEWTRTRVIQPMLVVRAPIAGVILEQLAQAGERLEAGGLLYRLADLSALTVEVHTPLDVARSLEPGTRFSLPEQAAVGRVAAVGSEVHSLDQGVLVRGVVEAGAERLRPGQFVRVRFETSRQGDAAYAIPTTAIVHVDEKPWVFREVPGGFEPVEVEVVGGGGPESVVIGSLTEGTQVVTRGCVALKAEWLANRRPQ